MKKAFSFGLLFFSALISYSQYVNTSSLDAKIVKHRILLVALPENDKRLINLYEQEDSLYATAYKVDMEGQRQALKGAVLRHWKFSDSIEVVSEKVARTLVKKDPEKYALMKFGEQIQDMVYVRPTVANPPVFSWSMKNGNLIYMYPSRYNIKAIGITSLVIELPKKVIEIYLPKMSPSEGDFIYAINQMQYIFSSLADMDNGFTNKLYRNTDALEPILKDKILLFDAAELYCKEDEIKKNYPYPFKIVSYAEIEKALKEKDSNYVFIQSARYETSNSIYYLSNAADGTIYGKFTGLTFDYGEKRGTANIVVYYPRITSKHISQFEIK